MATHSSILDWKIPCSEEPGGLQSMELRRVLRDLGTKHTHTLYSHNWEVSVISILQKLNLREVQ